MIIRRNDREEWANVFTHGAGLVLFCLLAPALLTLPNANFGVGLFVVGLIAVYSSSTLYHLWHHDNTKRLFKRIDHSAIYVLIAGTHSPFILKYIPSPYSWLFMVVIWGMALFGVVWKILWVFRWEKLSLPFYLALGWFAVIDIPFALYNGMTEQTLKFIAIGGVFYTVGAWFYQRNKPFYHAIWHIFVVAGSYFHYLAVRGVVV